MMLMLLALLGLVGQEAVAGAALQPGSPSTISAMAMAADCAKMMGEPASPKKMPCTGTPDCMMAMGCLAPLMIRDAHRDVFEPRITAVEPFWPATAVLSGSDLAPEPEPPTVLG